jgi:hypothetical protein
MLERDYKMNGAKAAIQLVLVCVVIASTAGFTWYLADRHFRAQAADETLQAIAELLKDNSRIIDSLVHNKIVDSEPTILDGYLQRIRRDGVANNSAVKQQIDTLSSNNTAIMTLLSKYAARARTAAFKAAADQYRNYAISFRDRWQSVFEIFMAGGNLPAAGPAFPGAFEAVLHVEVAAL